MHHPRKGLKGFSLRCRGRSAGSRAVDRDQSDFFPIEKFLSQCGFQQTSGGGARALSSAGAPPQAVPPATNRGGKV